jgi:hypothetical protein
LLALGDTSLLLGALSLPLGFLALIGLGVGAVAWAPAPRDLKRMEARLMDPGGLSATAPGRARARAGVALSIYAAALWVCFLVRISSAGDRRTAGQALARQVFLADSGRRQDLFVGRTGGAAGPRGRRSTLVRRPAGQFGHDDVAFRIVRPVLPFPPGHRHPADPNRLRLR